MIDFEKIITIILVCYTNSKNIASLMTKIKVAINNNNNKNNVNENSSQCV